MKDLKKRAENIMAYEQPIFNANDLEKRKELVFYTRAQQITTLYQVAYGHSEYLSPYSAKKFRDWLANCVADFEKDYMSEKQ